LYGIEVRQSAAGILVELWAEFDLLSARELTVCSQLYSHYLIFGNPSPEVTASARTFGLESWVRLHAGDGHREPPVISEVS
jgi:hypothetical protein